MEEKNYAWIVWVLAITALLATMVIQAKAQDCAWNESTLRCPSHNENNEPAFGSARCLEISPLSVVWLESDGCRCVADMRVVASWQACDGSDVATCDTYNFGYSITSVGAGSGSNFAGIRSTGSVAPGNPPSLIFYDEIMGVDCGGLMLFNFEVTCTCVRTEEITTIEITQNLDGSLTTVETTTVEALVVCGPHTDVPLRFTAECDQECVVGSEPERIAIGY